MWKALSIIIEGIITGLFRAKRESNEYNNIAVSVPASKKTKARVAKLRKKLKERTDTAQGNKVPKKLKEETSATRIAKLRKKLKERTGTK